MRRQTPPATRWRACWDGNSLQLFGNKGGRGDVMTLTKAELADLLFEKVGLNKREGKDMVEACIEELCGALQRGGRDTLSGPSSTRCAARLSAAKASACRASAACRCRTSRSAPSAIPRPGTVSRSAR